MPYALTDRNGEHAWEGDRVRWLPGGAEADVVQVEGSFAVLRFDAPLGEQAYYHDITANIEKVEVK